MTNKALNKSNELVDIFQSRLGWNKARVKFFVSFIIALCKVQTVCFNNLAQGFDGKANWIFLCPCLQAGGLSLQLKS